MDLENRPKNYYERGESQIGVLIGALVIGVLFYVVFSFMGWWQGMKESRMKKTQNFIEGQKPKTEFKKIHISKGYKMSFTKDRRN